MACLKFLIARVPLLLSILLTMCTFQNQKYIIKNFYAKILGLFNIYVV